MILNRLHEKGLIHPPKFLIDNCHYLTLMGSRTYACATDDSDNDIYGFCIPPKTQVFPHLNNEILGFGRQIKRFEQWSEHGINDKEAHKEYDLTVYSIVKYFQLLMDCNPNMIDSIFTHVNHVIHITSLGQIVKDNRRIFLHKGAYHRFRGYAYAQLHKMSTRNPKDGSKRAEDIKNKGFDSKFAYHLIRLALECEQILAVGDLDLECNSEILKSIRRGEWTEDWVRDYFKEKEKTLEALYRDSKIPHSPDEAQIKEVLLNCLEHHYGSLDNIINCQDKYEKAVNDISDIIAKLGR